MADPIAPTAALRSATAAAARCAEAQAVAALLPAARLTAAQQSAAGAQARSWVEAVRAERRAAGGVDAVMQAFA
ncbi:MAG: hypothetical protein ACK6DI_17855, partial [Betaproteobacteria bacterium]